MRNILIVLCLLVSIVCKAQNFTVVRVWDADSFEAVEQTTGTTVQIRLSGIDGPEKSQPYYNEGKEYLERLILNKKIKINLHSYDQYNRFIADVYINEIWVNKELVLQGYCFVYTKYCNNKVLYDAQYIAKYHSLHVWRNKSIVYPWDFRRLKHLKS